MAVQITPGPRPTRAAAAIRQSGVFAALASPPFRIFWAGLFLLFLGAQILQAAQSWLAFELTHSPLRLTLVLAIQSAPMLLLCLYGGAIIDRIQKRSAILICQGLSTLIAIPVAVLIATGQIQYWHLLVSSFLGGVTGAFMIIARNSIIAELVSRDRLFNAMALYSVAANIAGIAGPALSGTLMGSNSIHVAYYAGIIFSLAGIGVVYFLPATSTVAPRKGASTLRNLVEGLRYLKLQTVVVILLVMELALTIFAMGYSGLIPIFADLLGEESQGYGFMLSAGGVGSLVGALGVAGLGNFKSKGALLLLNGVAFGAGIIIFANSVFLANAFHLGSGGLYLAATLLLIIGMFGSAYTTTSSTLIQLNVSDEYRGRVTSVYGTVVAFYPLATLGAGALAETLGAPAAVTIGGSAWAAFMIGVAVLSRRIRRLG